MSEQNKALVRRFVDEVFVKGDMASLQELVDPDFVHHSWPFVRPGIEGLKQLVSMIQTGISDIRMDVEDIIAEGDKVVARCSARGVHKGELMGIPATGKSFSIQEIHIFRLQGGRIAEHWREVDIMGMLQQLGAMPRVSD
jgi:steroid delta-isomerase-like uncharacterized protein